MAGIFCTVVGAKQGTFQGDRTAGKATNQIPVLFLTQEVTRPFDAATGDERERISLTYQRIELTDLDGNATAEDDWLTAS